MNSFLDRPAVSAVRWVARVFGTLIAFMALFGIVEGITDLASYKSGRTIPHYLTDAGFLMVFVGCVVGWFKDLAASLFILGGILLILVTALAFPGEVEQVYFFAIPALPGFLYLYVHLASRKAKRGRETQG
jgi:hypothetical protein